MDTYSPKRRRISEKKYHVRRETNPNSLLQKIDITLDNIVKLILYNKEMINNGMNYLYNYSLESSGKMTKSHVYNQILKDISEINNKIDDKLRKNNNKLIEIHNQITNINKKVDTNNYRIKAIYDNINAISNHIIDNFGYQHMDDQTDDEKDSRFNYLI